MGYYDYIVGDWYSAVDPTRILDSREATGGWNAPLVAGAPQRVQVAGSALVPGIDEETRRAVQERSATSTHGKQANLDLA